MLVSSKRHNEELSKKDNLLQEKDLEINRLKEQISIIEHREKVLRQVLDILPNTWTFIVEDIQSGIINYSNKVGKELVRKATNRYINDWETTIHQFHKTPERSKWILWKMNNWDVNKNTTLEIWNSVIKSTSHKFIIDGKEYFLWLFSDSTLEKQEIINLDFLRENIEKLLKVFLNYSNLWVSFKILVKDLEDSKEWVNEQKKWINKTLKHIQDRFEKTNELFKEITIANTEVSSIFSALWLLALNWQIEAARQLDHWRWFWVVAEETMNTANKSQALMKSSIELVENGIKETTQEVENISNEIEQVLNNDTIEQLVKTRVSQSEGHLSELIEWIDNLIELWTNVSLNLKKIYSEKLEGNEKIKKIILSTKIDHLLFIIKLNTFLTTENWKIDFPKHTHCDLWKVLYLQEIEDKFKGNKNYDMLLSSHEEVHNIVKHLQDIIWKENKKGISKTTLEEFSTIIKGELLSNVNMVLFLIDILSKEL